MANMPPDILTLAQFHEVIAAAVQRFTHIRKKHPALKAYLVLSLRGDQVRIDSSLDETVKEFPGLLRDGVPKSRMLKFMNVKKPEKPTDAEVKEWQEKFESLSDLLEFDGSVQAEIRFNQLDYELIAKLQADELIDRNLTPQTRASIRIVLGTLGYFAHLMKRELSETGEGSSFPKP
jgi:hypothetical protein